MEFVLHTADISERKFPSIRPSVWKPTRRADLAHSHESRDDLPSSSYELLAIDIRIPPDAPCRHRPESVSLCRTQLLPVYNAYVAARRSIPVWYNLPKTSTAIP